MAIAIKNIPTLKGVDAKDFTGKAKDSEKKRKTVDFKQQFSIACDILKKAGFK